MKIRKYFWLRVSIIMLYLSNSLAATAQHFVPVSKKSSANFSIYAHKGGNDIFKGIFTEMKGDIIFNPKQIDKSSFDIVVNSGSVFTQNDQRDKDLKSAKFFSALKYPEIRIKSTSVTSDGKVIYILHGNLTMKGITKPVNIQFTATPIKDGYLFRGSFQVDRLLYNVGEKGDIDNMATVFVEIDAVRK